MLDLETAFVRCPLVAILRGVEPAEAEAVGDILVEAGFAIIEVPLNSPEPLRSIETLVKCFGDRALIGAGTVMRPGEIASIHSAGGRLIVSPHCDADLIRAAKVAGHVCIPGVATPSEAFVALGAGADALKAFPAEALSPTAIKSWLAVLPKGTRVLPVGGIGADNIKDYWAAGARGFGLGSSLYKPGDTLDQTRAKARAITAAFAAAQG